MRLCGTMILVKKDFFSGKWWQRSTFCRISWLKSISIKKITWKSGFYLPWQLFLVIETIQWRHNYKFSIKLQFIVIILTIKIYFRDINLANLRYQNPIKSSIFNRLIKSMRKIPLKFFMTFNNNAYVICVTYRLINNKNVKSHFARQNENINLFFIVVHWAICIQS